MSSLPICENLNAFEPSYCKKVFRGVIRQQLKVLPPGLLRSNFNFSVIKTRPSLYGQKRGVLMGCFS